MKHATDGSDPWARAERTTRELYGSFVMNERRWRLVACIAVALNIPTALSLAYVAAQPRRIPFVIEQDVSGQLRAIGELSPGNYAAPELIRSELGRFIQQWRGVTPDRAVQSDWLRRVLSMLPTTGSARGKVAADLERNLPTERAKRETVSVDVRSALPISEESWQIEWVERVYSRTGEELGRTPMKAIVQVVQKPPTTDAAFQLNPLGLLIITIDWNKIGEVS